MLGPSTRILRMNIEFILRDGTHYVFKNYKGFSELLEALEPNPDELLEILEYFTLEEFEIAHHEYHKYLVFNEALEDIITKGKLWSKEELKEFSKYDLDNPVLEWLMIKETREEKEIKEKLSLDSFGVKDLDSDNIILYCLVNKPNQDKFNNACKMGHLKVAQWLYSLGGVNIHINNENAFRWACKWVQLEVAQWLYSLGGVNIHIMDEDAFRWACLRGYLNIAQWLYSLGDVNIHINDEEAFRLACIKGHLEVVQWLYSLGDVDIHTRDDGAFKKACSYGKLKVAQWLWSLGGFHKENIDTGYVHIKDWLVTLE
jgi:hypothetical protein